MVWLLLTACLPDPGDPVYPERPPFVDPDDDFLDGPVPWNGQPRLSVGLFYEGGSTDEVEIDNSSTNFFIYDGTFEVITTEERVEGLAADIFEATPFGYLGGGIHWESPRDLSEWTHMHVSFRSEDAVFSGLTFGMAANGAEVRINATDYGFETDGEWHDLVVPLSDLIGVDTSAVNIAFQIIVPGTSDGQQLFIDNLYFSQDGETGGAE